MSVLTGSVHVHGQPARTAVVEIHNKDGDVVDQVQVNDRGSYRYHLSAGNWTLNVWDAHGHRGRAEVTIEEGRDLNIDVELGEPEGGHPTT